MTEYFPTTVALDGGPTLNGWYTNAGHQSVVVFAHGNGFCGRVYQPMLNLLAEHHDLLLYDVPGHGESPAFPFVGWNRTADFLHQAVVHSHEIIGARNLHLVGHSLGGVFAILAASKNPKMFRSMVLLDPIIFPPALLFVLRCMKAMRLTSFFHPHVKPTLRRRNGWSGTDEALAYFGDRGVFKNWTDEALASYVEHALTESASVDTEQNGSVVLRCDPKTEANWFATLPTGLWSALRSLSMPVKIIMGQDTYPFALRAAHHAQKLNSAIEFSQAAGGHCFMQEAPHITARTVLTTLASEKYR